jgi:hypothetical protein
MAVIGLNFSRMLVEKKESTASKININNNVSIKNVESIDFALGKNKQDGLKFTFEYSSKYEPDFAEMTFSGDVLFLESEKEVKRILEEWKKKKSVSKEVMAEVLNSILGKCNVQALVMARDFNLPPPIMLPKVKVDEGEGKKE